MNSSYFEIVEQTNSPARARRLLDEGKVTFVVEIPVDFTRNIVRGSQPTLVIEADATDPAAGSYALAAFNTLATTALRDDLEGPLAARAARPATVPGHHASALQSGIEHAIQHRAGAARSDPHHDDGAAHLPGADARARARHLRESARHAGDAARDHAGQDRPQHPDRRHSERCHPAGGALCVRCADAGLACYSVACPRCLHRDVAGGRLHVLHHRGEPVAGDADDGVLPVALDPAFRLRVSVQGDAAMGAMDRRSSAGDTLPAHRHGVLPKGNGWTETWPEVWPLLIFLLVVTTMAVARFRRTLD